MDKELNPKVSSYSRPALTAEELWEEKKSFIYLVCSAILTMFMGVMTSEKFHILGFNQMNWNFFGYVIATSFYVFVLVLSFPRPGERVVDFIITYVLLFIFGMVFQEFTVKSFKELGNANISVFSFLSLYVLVWGSCNLLNKSENIKSISLFSFVFTFGFFFAFFHDDMSFLTSLPMFLTIFYYVFIVFIVGSVSFLYFLVSDPKIQLLTSSIALLNLCSNFLLFMFGFYLVLR